MGQYKAPKMPKIVANNSKFSKKHDGQISDLQERCAELTRPVDFFLHKVRDLQDQHPDDLDPEAILEITAKFAMLIRDHLGGLAGQMHETRMANARSALGLNNDDDSLNMFDPQTLQEELKAQRTLSSTFNKDKNGSDSRRGRNNSNYANYDNSSHNSNDSRSHGTKSNWRNNNQDRRSRSRSSRGNNGDNRSSSFHRNNQQRRGNSNHRGRSSSRRNDRSPRSEDGFSDS